MRQNFHVSLKLILHNDKGQMLTLTSESKAYSHPCDIPGGRIDEGEDNLSFRDILDREIKEEIGPNVQYSFESHPVAVTRHKVLGKLRKSSKEDLHLLYVYFAGEYISGDIHISDEHTGYKWRDITVDNIDEYFSASLNEGIRTYLQTKSL